MRFRCPVALMPKCLSSSWPRRWAAPAVARPCRRKVSAYCSRCTAANHTAMSRSSLWLPSPSGCRLCCPRLGGVRPCEHRLPAVLPRQPGPAPTARWLRCSLCKRPPSGGLGPLPNRLCLSGACTLLSPASVAPNSQPRFLFLSLPNRVCLSGASTVTKHAWTLSCLGEASVFDFPT